MPGAEAAGAATLDEASAGAAQLGKVAAGAATLGKAASGAAQLGTGLAQHGKGSSRASTLGKQLTPLWHAATAPGTVVIAQTPTVASTLPLPWPRPLMDAGSSLLSHRPVFAQTPTAVSTCHYPGLVPSWLLGHHC